MLYPNQTGIPGEMRFGPGGPVANQAQPPMQFAQKQPQPDIPMYAPTPSPMGAAPGAPPPMAPKPSQAPQPQVMPQAPQGAAPAPGGAPQVSPGRTALIRSVMARAGQPKGGMGQPQVGRPMPQMAKPRAPMFRPPGRG